jgi:naphthalene 1,2-dioxygenase ferredoxin component
VPSCWRHLPDCQGHSVDSETWLTAALASTLGTDRMVGLDLGGVAIALYNVDGVFYASSNICTHAFSYLTDGWLEGPIIECPLHAGRFDVRTGEGQGAPITCDLKTFATRVVGDEIQVRITNAGA